MPYDAKDPRASLTSGPSSGSTSATDFAGTEYAGSQPSRNAAAEASGLRQ